MAWLPDGEKIAKIPLSVSAQLTNVSDRQTDGRTYGRTDRHGMPAIAALMHSIARQKSHEKSPLIGRVDGTATVGDLGSNKHARTTWIT